MRVILTGARDVLIELWLIVFAYGKILSSIDDANNHAGHLVLAPHESAAQRVAVRKVTVRECLVHDQGTRGVIAGRQERVAPPHANSHGAVIVRRDGVRIKESAYCLSGIRKLKPGHEARSSGERDHPAGGGRLHSWQGGQFAERRSDIYPFAPLIPVNLRRKVYIPIRGMPYIEARVDLIRTQQVSQEKDTRGQHHQ